MNFNGKRVLILGDSQAEGIAPTLADLLESAGAQVSVSVHSGMILARALTDLDLTSLARGQSVVVISLGGNNPPTSESRARDQMAQLLAPFSGKTLFWLTVLPSVDPSLQPAREAMARWQQSFLPGRGVNVMNGSALTSDLPRRDAVHLFASGYENLAERIAVKMGRTTSFFQRVGWGLLGTAIGVATATWAVSRRS
jgi:hypothetical protein